MDTDFNTFDHARKLSAMTTADAAENYRSFSLIVIFK